MYLRTFEISNHDILQNLLFQNLYKLFLRVHNLSAPGLVWQAASKATKVKLDLLSDIDILLMVEKGIRGEICHSIYRYAKANNKYMKDYDKNEES